MRGPEPQKVVGLEPVTELAELPGLLPGEKAFSVAIADSVDLEFWHWSHSGVRIYTG